MKYENVEKCKEVLPKGFEISDVLDTCIRASKRVNEKVYIECLVSENDCCYPFGFRIEGKKEAIIEFVENLKLDASSK